LKNKLKQINLNEDKKAFSSDTAKFNKTLDFNLVLKMLFPIRLRQLMEEDFELKKEFKNEKRQLSKLLKHKKTNFIAIETKTKVYKQTRKLKQVAKLKTKTAKEKKVKLGNPANSKGNF
jgi:hypothetical protein